MKPAVSIIFFLFIIPLKSESQIYIGDKNDNIIDFCLSKDGDHLYVPLLNKIEIWDTKTLSLERTLPSKKQSQVLAIDINGSGKNLVTSYKDSSIIIRDLNNFSDTIFFEHNRSLITSVKFSPNDSLLATVLSDRTIIIWDVIKLMPKYKISIHKNDITGIDFLDNSRLISCSADKEIIIWDIFHEKAITKWRASNNWLRDISLNRSKSKLASCGDDGKIVIWNITDVNNIKKISEKRICNNWLMACDFYDDNTYVVAGHNRKVDIFTPYGQDRYKSNSIINKVAFLPNSKYLIVAIATQNSGLIIVNAKDMKSIN